MATTAPQASAVERVWLKSYPPGVPAEADIDAYASIRDILKVSCKKFASLPAFTCMDATIDYAELDLHSARFGAWLQHEAGLKKGDRVALMMPNMLQYPIALFGILRAGMVAVNCNPLYTPRELEHQLNDAGASAIVILENFAHTLQQVIAKTPVKKVVTTQLGDLLGWPKSMIVNWVVKHRRKLVPAWDIQGTMTFKTALSQGSRHAIEESPLGHDDLAFLQYTGGTTGISKGAMLTHGNIVANLQQVSAWIGREFVDGREVAITALPMYHIFALSGSCLCNMKIGAHNILITNPRDMPGFVKELGKYPFSTMSGVNTLFNGLMTPDGYVKIVDRKKDMIVVSGFKVFPNEVEDVVAMLPGVREVCAVPAPDPHSGETVRLVIVRKDPSLTKEQVIEHCRKNLTGYKRPHIVEFWDELPKSNVGKVLRREVRAVPPKE